MPPLHPVYSRGVWNWQKHLTVASRIRYAGRRTRSHEKQWALLLYLVGRKMRLFFRASLDDPTKDPGIKMVGPQFLNKRGPTLAD
jgi:hypothetical protein